MCEKAKWNQKTPEEKKWFLIKVIGGTLFLLGGCIFGIVSLYLSGWDFVKFITNPTTDLIILVCLAVGIVLFSLKPIGRKK